MNSLLKRVAANLRDTMEEISGGDIVLHEEGWERLAQASIEAINSPARGEAPDPTSSAHLAEAWDASRTEDEIEASLLSQREKLEALKPNWDGYGAYPIPSGVLSVIFEEVTTEGCFVDMIPGADGSVQAEWHLRGDVDVEYSVTPGGRRELYVRYTRYPGTVYQPAGGEDKIAQHLHEVDAGLWHEGVELHSVLDSTVVDDEDDNAVIRLL